MLRARLAVLGALDDDALDGAGRDEDDDVESHFVSDADDGVVCRSPTSVL